MKNPPRVSTHAWNLLAQMTLEEKTCQLATLYGFNRVLKDQLPTSAWKDEVWKDGIGNIDEHCNGVRGAGPECAKPPSRHAEVMNAVQRFFIEETRLGVPADLTNEGIRGLCHWGATAFPASTGVCCTWDAPLVREIGRVTGREGRMLGYTNVYAPILDLARDPRWGRVVETYTEDPYLASVLGVEMVKGLQEENVTSTPGRQTDVYNWYGMTVAWTMVETLRMAGKHPNRSVLLKAAQSLDTGANPFLLPGIRLETSRTDYRPMEYVYLYRYDNKEWVKASGLLHAKG